MINTVELRQLAYFEAVVRCGGFTRGRRAAAHRPARGLRPDPAAGGGARHAAARAHHPPGRADPRRASCSWPGPAASWPSSTAPAPSWPSWPRCCRGRVRIGATQVLGPFDLPARPGRSSHAATRALRLTLRSGLIATLLGLAGRRRDRPGARPGPRRPARPASPPGRWCRRAWCSCRAGPAGRARRPRLADVRDEPFVCLPAEQRPAQRSWTAAAAAAGFTPRVQFETYSPASIRELVVGRPRGRAARRVGGASARARRSGPPAAARAGTPADRRDRCPGPGPGPGRPGLAAAHGAERRHARARGS